MMQYQWTLRTAKEEGQQLIQDILATDTRGAPLKPTFSTFFPLETTGKLSISDSPRFENGTLVGVMREIKTDLELNKGFRVVMCQVPPRELVAEYITVVEHLEEVFKKDVNRGMADASFLLRNEPWVQLGVRFADLKGTTVDPTPKSLKGCQDLVNTVDCFEQPWLKEQFVILAQTIKPNLDNYEAAQNARTLPYQLMLTQVHLPPFHTSYMPVLSDKGFRTNKKRHVQDIAAEGGKAAPKGKQPGDFPTPSEATLRGKRSGGKGAKTWQIKKQQRTSESNQHQ